MASNDKHFESTFNLNHCPRTYDEVIRYKIKVYPYATSTCVFSSYNSGYSEDYLAWKKIIGKLQRRGIKRRSF